MKIQYTFCEGMDGKEVIWYERDFLGVRHGVNHSQQHQEIETHFEIVKRAIEKPNQVMEDTENDKRKCYYAWFPGAKKYPNMHMKVVIEETFLAKIGLAKPWVVTAYFTSHIKETKNIWPISN